jgi:hypothetical protein
MNHGRARKTANRSLGFLYPLRMFDGVRVGALRSIASKAVPEWQAREGRFSGFKAVVFRQFDGGFASFYILQKTWWAAFSSAEPDRLSYKATKELPREPLEISSAEPETHVLITALGLEAEAVRRAQRDPSATESEQSLYRAVLAARIALLLVISRHESAAGRLAADVLEPFADVRPDELPSE